MTAQVSHTIEYSSGTGWPAPPPPRQDSFRTANGLEGYEQLILDAMLGDQALFTQADGVERLWEISAPLLENPPPVEPYIPGPEPSLGRLTAPIRWYLTDAGSAS